MATRWHSPVFEKPPLDDHSRCDVWVLLDGRAYPGSYVDFGLDEAGPATYEFSIEGRVGPVSPQFWAVRLPGESTPPSLTTILPELSAEVAEEEEEPDWKRDPFQGSP